MRPGPDEPNRAAENPLSRILWLTLVKYSTIGGAQTAASFAYYAFFALFPLLLLLVAIGSYFFNSAHAGSLVIDELSRYILVDSDKHDLVSQTVRGIIKTRRGVGSFAVLGLLWSSLRFFQCLVHGINRAWGTHEYSWWRLPLQNLFMVAILVTALVIGMLGPIALRAFEKMVWSLNFSLGANLLVFAFETVRFLLPSAVLFCGFCMFYRLAPRRRITFRDVWLAALSVTLLIQLLQGLFLLYAKNVAHFNAVYGAFGSVIAVLMWIYLSGSVIILGGCFCAALSEVMEAHSLGGSSKGVPQGARRKELPP
jgi:Ca2+-transporting ATPase